MKRTGITAALAASLALSAPAGWAQPPSPLPAYRLPLGGDYPAPALSKDPVAARCQALATASFSGRYARIPDAPSSINSARVVPAGGTHGPADDDLPEYCRVEGIIAPTVGFLVRMPTKDWNGRFMMGGCGGPCGNYLEDRIDAALVRKFAVVTTDMGHKGSGWLFAYNNRQGQTDFAYRATHLTAVVAKQVIADFYGEPAKFNYFLGCSTGGRQTLIEAQRFPADFDGIVSGAPVYDEIGDTPYFIEWNILSNTAADGSSILTRNLLPVIHKAVLAKCDALDGLTDGVLQNPLACAFDPKSIVCGGGAPAGACLTPGQATVAQKIHDGARNSKGEKLYFGMPWGSEDQWSYWIGADGKQHWPDGTSITAYAGYDQPAGPTYKLSDFNYDAAPARLDLTGSIYNPVNPDLSRFAKAGHKLILFHGMNDNNIPVEASLQYYQAAVRANGGLEPTKTFFRFFMPPSVNHCRGGEGGGEIDWITAIQDWVEKGRAPDPVIAYRPVKPYPTAPRAMEDYGLTYSKFGRHPLAADYYDTSRPVFAYPLQAKYRGKGDAKDAGNWTSAPATYPAL